MKEELKKSGHTALGLLNGTVTGVCDGGIGMLYYAPTYLRRTAVDFKEAQEDCKIWARQFRESGKEMYALARRVDGVTECIVGRVTILVGSAIAIPMVYELVTNSENGALHLGYLFPFILANATSAVYELVRGSFKGATALIKRGRIQPVSAGSIDDTFT